MTLKSSSYLLPKFSRVPLTIVLISKISTMVNGTLLNFGKRYEDNLRVIFDQCTKVRFVSFLSGEFTTMAVISPPERKLAKHTSVQWPRLHLGLDVLSNQKTFKMVVTYVLVVFFNFSN